MIVSNGISGCGPFEPATFCAQPVPAQQTAMRRPPSALRGPLDRRLHLRLLAHVAGDELEPELGAERLALLGVDVGDRHVRAARVQRANRRLAETGGAAGRRVLRCRRCSSRESLLIRAHA